MSAYNWRKGGIRAPNMFRADPQRLTSADGTRWATGRTAKGETATRGVKVPVEIWTLKERDEAGRVVVRDTHCSRARAEAWIAAR
jgi:hypothetical protein